MKVLIAQLCPTPCGPMYCSAPGSFVHGLLQARVLEWVAIPFSRDLPDPGIKPGFPALQADSLLSELPGKPGSNWGLLDSEHRVLATGPPGKSPESFILSSSDVSL